MSIDYDALNATWPLSGNWAIFPPGGSGASAETAGFMVFGVQPNGDRLISAGHGPCFLYGGRAIESDGGIRVVPIEGALDPLVPCDPGPAASSYTKAVECLSAGCMVRVDTDVLHLTGADGEKVADLVHTTNAVP